MPVDGCFHFVYRMELLLTFGRGTFSWSSVYPEKGDQIELALVQGA